MEKTPDFRYAIDRNDPEKKQVLLQAYKLLGLGHLLTPEMIKNAAGAMNFEGITKELLIKRGFVVLGLDGLPIQNLISKGCPISVHLHVKNSRPDIIENLSVPVEVAFKPSPDDFFLPSSNGKNLKDQEGMAQEYGEKLSKDVGYVKGIIGSVQNYTLMTFEFLRKYNVQLFGPDYLWRYARTNTEMVGAYAIHVGSFRNYGFTITAGQSFVGYANIFAVPLIVPGSL